MVGARMICWLELLFLVLVLLKTEGVNVSITFVLAEGAVCLDGSPPAYHLDRGFGDGINNWLVQLEGGGWCNNITSCKERKNTRLGSSKRMLRSIGFSGILSRFANRNPDFYNWNRIKVRYCDGASFTGDRLKQIDNLYFRGNKIFVAVINDLLAKGMRNAKNAIISGCSAGGLASILHCNQFKELLPTANIKCLADAGFFINVNDISGVARIKSFFEGVVKLHESNLNPDCIKQQPRRPEMCFFPQNMVKFIKAPLFILNAAYDSWQIKNILAPGASDPHGLWHYCKLDIEKCTSTQLEIMQGFRMEFLNALKGAGDSLDRATFIDSCYAHCQSETQDTWLSKVSPKLNKMTIAEAVGLWYHNRSSSGTNLLDCSYPCNKSCRNRVFDNKGLGY